MSSFDYKRSTITKYRAGTANDPYIDITETKKVINNVIQLDEIPVSSNKVKINGMYEAPNSYTGDLTENEYRVDYTEGIIHFHPAAEGKTLTYYYKGRGNHFVSADRIWTKEQDGEVIETLGEILQAGQEAVGNIKELSDLMHEAEASIGNANAAANAANTNAILAQESANEASTQGDYAKQQGDYAKSQGEAALIAKNDTVNATNNAIQATADARKATEDTIVATNSANTAADNANAKGEYAQQQGDYAKSTTDNLVDVGTSLVNKGIYDNSTSYKPLNIVVYNSGVYQCLYECTGILPTNSNYWQLLMQTTTSVTWDSVVGRPDVEGHIHNTSNPHSVTASQVGAYSKLEADARFASSDALLSHTSNNDIHVTSSEKASWNNKQDTLGFIPENSANKGLPNGYPSLDETGYVPASQLNLPSDLETKEGAQAKVDALGSKVTTQLAEKASQSDLLNHTGAKASSAEVHGLRVQADKFQYQKANGEWQEVSGGGEQETTVNLRYYVNSQTGNDSNSGLSATSAFKTIQHAINIIPKILKHSARIDLAAGYYDETVYIYDFKGFSTLQILGQGAVTVKDIRLASCACTVELDTLTIDANSFPVKHCSNVTLRKITRSGRVDAFSIESSTYVYIVDCVSNNCNTFLSALNGARVIVSANNGAGNNTGLRVGSLAEVYKDGSQPGATTAESTFFGGVIR